MWELYFECKKIKETVQTANFTVFTMCGRELPAEMTYFWWKLEKRKRIFLNDSYLYDLNRVYHEKADVLSFLKMWQFLSFEDFKTELLPVKVGWKLKKKFSGEAVLKKKCSKVDPMMR